MDMAEVPNLRDMIAKELDSLIEQGFDLLDDLHDKDGKKFHASYQQWYTRALGAVRALVPERLEEFAKLYQGEKRKELNSLTYSISDYMLGIVFGNPRLKGREKLPALHRFHQQVLIVQSTKTRLNDILSNVRGVVQAQLLDSEIEAARELLHSNHIRAAGAVAGVVLERHLRQMCAVRNLPSRKKNPTIADWNEVLKEAGVFDVPTWRAIQYLGDIRNLCDHPRTREPTKDEVDELIRGVERIIKTQA